MPKLYGSLQPFSDKEYRKLHEATLSILEKVGMYVDNEDVLEYARKAGNKVDFEKKVVRFQGGVVESNIQNCNSLDRHERPENLIFSCDGGSGYVLDYATMRMRGATIQDVQDFCRLLDALENVDETSFPLFPHDTPYPIMDLTIWRHVWANTAKSGGGGLSRNGCMLFNTSPAAIGYLIKMAGVRYGGDKRPDGTPLISGFVGASSPLRFDREIAEAMVTLAREKQVVGIGSNVIGGAQAPVTLAGVVAMENAERMGLLSLLMAVDPKAYVYFCNHPNYLDMVDANVANGSPEHSLMATCATGLLRYYGFQLLANHPVMATGAQVPGAQVSVEKALQAMMAGLSGSSGICVCGALNEGMCYEQLVIDNEIAGMVKHYLKGMDITDETIALDVIEEVGIGGNFLEHPSVAANVRSVYWKPELWNRKRYSEWLRLGAEEVMDKAHSKVVDILGRHHPKPLSDQQEKEMDEILAEATAVLNK